ncbi:MAG: hypothetical protein Q9219_003156 [cf. Caloplaca sp. 3 TL-2023]
MQSSSNASEAWHQAVEGYTQALAPRHQLEFKAPTTVDQCLQILIHYRSHKKGFTRILEFCKPLIEPLKRFEGAIDVIVQTNSGIASPIWGPLRLAIMVASEHFRTLERLVFMIDKIAGSIRRYQDFETLFALHEGVRNAVGALHCDLIYLCTRVVRFHARALRYALASFDKEFGPISEAIDLHSAEVDRAANAAHMMESKAVRDQILLEKQAHVLHEVLRWLSPSTAEDNLRMHLGNYMSGSCDWVIASTKFNDWLRKKSSAENSLQIAGRPGSGKSTLAAFLIRHLSKSSLPVLYFFCDRSDCEKRSTLYVIRTLLAQLLKIDSSLAHQILPHYRNCGRTFADSYEILFGLLQAVMKHCQNRAFCIVVDGVDECIDAFDQWDGLLFQLQSCLQDAKTKLIVTQRTSADGKDPSLTPWTNQEWSASQELLMRPKFASQHIHEYIQRRARNIPMVANTEDEAKIVTRISKASDGLWLYARLMIDEVERAPSKESIERCLSSLPHGLFDLYTQIVHSCETRMTEDQRKFAKHLYIWLDVNDYMPDFLSENFDRLPYNTLQLIFRFVNGGNDVHDAASLAQELGKPLIAAHHLDSTYEFDFVHYSAYRYLARCSEISAPGTEISGFSQIIQPLKLKQFHRGVVAIWYFSECADSSQKLLDLKETSKMGDSVGSDSIGSYFEMAYGLWNAFKADLGPLNGLSDKETAEAEGLILQLTDFLRSDRALRWFEMATIINYSGDYRLLLDNVQDALFTTISGSNTVNKNFQDFLYQKKAFFQKWEFILERTTPWLAKKGWDIPEQERSSLETDPSARKMMQIAEYWGQVSFADDQGNIQKYQPPRMWREEVIFCVHCSRPMSKDSYSKHLEFACRFNHAKGPLKTRRERVWNSFMTKLKT